MLGLFGIGREEEQEFVSELKAVETEDRLRDAVGDMLADAGLEIRDTNTPTEFTAAASVAIVKLILHSAGVDIGNLSFENRFVTGLFGFLVAHNLSRRTDADLGIVLGIAGLELFSREEIEDIYKLGSSYRRLRQQRQMYRTLREIIEQFLSRPDSNTLAQLTEAYELCLKPEA